MNFVLAKIRVLAWQEDLEQEILARECKQATDKEKMFAKRSYLYLMISSGVFFLIPFTLKSLSNVIIVKSNFCEIEN
jgi:hypothetical protein